MMMDAEDVWPRKETFRLPTYDEVAEEIQEKEKKLAQYEEKISGNVSCNNYFVQAASDTRRTIANLRERQDRII